MREGEEDKEKETDERWLFVQGLFPHGLPARLRSVQVKGTWRAEVG